MNRHLRTCQILTRRTGIPSLDRLLSRISINDQHCSCRYLQVSNCKDQNLHQHDRNQNVNSTHSLFRKSFLSLSYNRKLSIHSNKSFSSDVALLREDNDDVNANFSIHPSEIRTTEIVDNVQVVESSRMDKDEVGKTPIHPKRNKKVIKYPFKGKGLKNPVYTENFESSKDFLESLSIPTDELQFYPSVQNMNKEDILSCVKKLKEHHIVCIFSLFLIQRAYQELMEENGMVKRRDVLWDSTLKGVSFRKVAKYLEFGNDRYKLTSVREVVTYMELCRLLDQPGLDPNILVEQLARVGVFDSLAVINNKTKKFRSVGASPQDILNNLELFKCKTSVLDTKIQLYQNQIGGIDGVFPVELFLSSMSLAHFREMLGVDDDVLELCKLLNTTFFEYSRCWGHNAINRFNIVDMVYKVRMCLAVGITEVELFNNLNILNRISVKQCLQVTNSLRETSLPVSVSILLAMSGMLERRVKKYPPGDTDGTTGIKDGTTSGDALTKSLTKNKGKSDNTKPLKTSIYMWRRIVLRKMGHLLQLDKSVRRMMVRADIRVDNIQLVDMTENLDYLLSLKFTKDHISQCPIILLHPAQTLVRAINNLDRLVLDLSSSSSSSSSLSPSLSTFTSSSSSSLSTIAMSFPNEEVEEDETEPPSPHFEQEQDLTSDVLGRKDILFRIRLDPVFCLNVLQYCLEKEGNFNLTSATTQSIFEFLH